MALLLGCAYTSQTVDLRPSYMVPGSKVGAKLPVVVRVLDERSDKNFGHRGTGAVTGAEIKMGLPVDQVFQREIARGLAALNFVPSDEPQTRDVKIEIRELAYYATQGLWTAGFHTKAALKVYARNGSRTYEKFYRAEQERRGAVVPDAAKNERLLNEVTDKLLAQLFSDHELFRFLASDPQGLEAPSRP